MTPGLNIQPFMNACAGLRACMSPRTTVMPSGPFLAAAEDLYTALGPQHLPGFPEHLRQEVRSVIDHLPKDQLSRVMAGVALTQLREKGLFPERDVAKDENAVHELLSGLIQSSPGALPAAALVDGGVQVHKTVYRATLRGIYEDDDRGDTMVFGSIGADGNFHIARPSRMVGKLSRKTGSEAEPLPPIPTVDVMGKPESVRPAEPAVVAPPPPTAEHAAGVNAFAFFRAIKSGRLADTEPVMLSSDEELFLEVCEEKFQAAVKVSEQAVADFQLQFLLSCRDREDLIGVMLRAVQKGIVSLGMVVQAWFDSLQKDDLPLVDPDDNLLLKLSNVPLTRSGLKVQMAPPTDFVLGKQIGQGGTSRVFRAHEVGPNRDVAIKIVTISDPTQREQLSKCFEDERQNQGLFSSERFVQVFNTGWTPQGSPYIAMELCDGALTDWLDDVRTRKIDFDLNRALDIARQMLTALAEMHQKNYVHRDIKPDNFFLKNGRVKLGDTGLSKHKDQLPKTAPHSPWGTPGYMPPEVAKGEAPDDKTNDTWAVGVVLYELFTGAFCFDGQSPSAWIINSITKTPPPPSRLVPGRNIPEVIDRIVMKCLEKDPANRYPDALAVLHDLVTVRAQSLVDEADQNRRMSYHTGADIKIHQDIWRDLIKDALRELRRVYDEFPLPSILKDRIRLNKELFDWADTAGDTEELMAIRTSILALDREIQGKGPNDASYQPLTDAAVAVSQPIQYRFTHDSDIDPRSKPRYDVLKSEERGGYLDHAGRLDPQYRLKDSPVSSRRGPIYSIRFTSMDHMPVNIPLPPRPSANGKPYPVRIPNYRLNEFHPDLQEKLVIIPAGAAAPVRPPTGRLAQKVEEVRATTGDIGVLPLPTNLDYYKFLERVYAADPASLVRYLPQGWQQDKTGAFVNIHGGAIDWNLPIIGIDREQTDAYLADLSREYGRPFRNISLFEWKLLCRPFDNRVWTWGGAVPEKGAVVFRFPGPDNRLEPVNMPHLRDLSGFSVPEFEDRGNGPVTYRRALRHVIGNTFKRLHLTPEEQQRVFDGNVFADEIVNQYGAYTRTNFLKFLKDNDVLAGVAYDQEPTLTPDGLKSRPRNFRGPIGFFPTTELRAADASPWVEALTGREPSNRPPR